MIDGLMALFIASHLQNVSLQQNSTAANESGELLSLSVELKWEAKGRQNLKWGPLKTLPSFGFVCVGQPSSPDGDQLRYRHCSRQSLACVGVVKP